MSSGSERIIETRITIREPGVGTFDFSTAAAAFAAEFSIFERDPPGSNSGRKVLEASATASTGTITITEYNPPTDRAYGLMVGTFTATLDFGPDDPERSATIEGSFRIPIDPLLGAPRG